MGNVDQQDPAQASQRLVLPAGRVRVKPPPGAPKDIAGCAIAGICCQDGHRISGREIIGAIASMRERSNGLGGGFAAYGIYPEHPREYALHVMYDAREAADRTERYLTEVFEVRHRERIPTRAVEAIHGRPLFERYFVEPRPNVRERYYDFNDDDIVVMAVMHVNAHLDGAFVFS